MESVKAATSQGAGEIKGIIIYKPLKRIPVITKILVTTMTVFIIMKKLSSKMISKYSNSILLSNLCRRGRIDRLQHIASSNCL